MALGLKIARAWAADDNNGQALLGQGFPDSKVEGGPVLCGNLRDGDAAPTDDGRDIYSHT